MSVACFAIFVVFLIAQSLTGWRAAVADAIEHGGSSFGYWHYLTTGQFAEATFENWESEFLQMGAFVLLTIFLLQKGSGESKQDTTTPETRTPGAPATTRTRRGRCGAAASGSLCTRTAC